MPWKNGLRPLIFGGAILAFGLVQQAQAGPFHARRGPGDTRAWENSIEANINQALSDGTLTSHAARSDLAQLDEIRHIDSDDRDGAGRLQPDQYRDISARLDALSRGLPVDTGGGPQG